MAKKEVFEWIQSGQKDELKHIRSTIFKKEHGELREVLRENNYGRVIPIAARAVMRS